MGRINPILNSFRLLGSKLLLILAICCFPLVGFSQIGPIGTETQVNTSTAGSQQNPAIATNKSGDYVIVWESDGTDGSKYGIYGQLFNADGSLNGAEFLVNTYTSNDQRFPTVAMDGSGNFLISWMSYLQDGSGWGVYYRMYDNSGSAITGANRANASTTGDQRNPEAFCNDAGSFFITWSDISTDGTTYTIMGAPYNTSGTKVSADFQINSSTISSLAYSTGAMANDGSFMLVWQADGLDGSGMGVYARRYTNTNTPQANDFLVNTSTSGNQQAPDVAVDSAGNYAVVWEAYESGNSAYGIFAQNYYTSGLPQGTQYTITSTVNDSKWPSVSMSTNGYYTVTWTTDNLDGSYAGVYAQSYELDGTPIGSSSLLNTSTTNFQQFSQIAHAIDDTLVIAWQDGLRSGAGTTDGDAYGVFSQRSKLILPLELALDSVDNLCFGEALGSINSTVTGGVSPYTYAWSQGGSGASSINLLAGTYTLTVSDNVGSTIIDSIEVLQPASALVASVVVDSNANCNGGADGGASSSAVGGTAPYTYLWSNAATAASITGIAAGTYTVTITDNNGCTSSSSETITEPTALVNSISAQTNVSINGGSDGSATASGSGGTSPYTYAWSNGGTTASISSLSAGTYTVSLTDNNGCGPVTSSVTITEPSVLTASISSQTNNNCFGGSSGSLTASASGGVPSYTYQWSDGQTSATASSLAAGTYTVTITDSNGATASTSASLTEPANLVASISAQSNVSVNGGSDGSATAAGSGGTGPYTYSWNTGGTLATESNLIAGTYTVSIADANGCGPAITTVTITQPSSLIVTIPATTDVDCNGNSTGTATASGSGGVSPYTYQWSNGATTATVSSLTAGTYTVTLTDNNAATTTISTTITQPAVLLASISGQSNASSNGASDGSATATGTGGTSPYTYAWSNGASSASATGLSAGTYSVSITDNNGCGPAITTVTISEPSALGSSITNQTNVDCNGNSTGSLTVTGLGGVSPYTYQWSDGQTTAMASNLTAGAYTVTIFDNSSATVTSTATITEPAMLAIIMSKTDAVCSNLDGTATASVSGGTGPYTYTWSNGGSTSTISALAPATYTVTISDNNACTTTNVIQVQRDLSSCQGATNLRTLFIQDTSAQLRWDPVGNARLYKIVFKPAGGGSWTQIFFRDANLPSIWNMSGLTPSTKYDWSIMVRDTNGTWSGLAPVVRFTTLSAPCNSPTSSTVAPIQSNQAKVSWTAMPGALKYRIQYRVQGSGPWTALTISRNFVWLSGLSPNTSYEYRLKSVCEYGSSSGTKWGVISQFTTDSAPTFGATGVGNPGSSLEAIIYPNPNEGSFNLEIESSDLNEKVIEILDMKGVVLYRARTGIIYSTKLQIDMILAKGMYMLRVISPEEQVNTRLIIQ